MFSTSSLAGLHTALATPFLKGEIDWTSLKKIVRQQLDGGVDGIVVCGTTAESPTLTKDEKKQLFEFIRSEVAGQVTLTMGTGSYSTAETIQSTKEAKAMGAAAALVVVPYYNKPSQRGLILHYTKVAQEGGLPVILYNVPGRTVARLELETVQTLSKVEGIVAIKEATGDIEFGEQIAKTTTLLLLSGDDESCMRLASVGGRGVISVISHLIPKVMSSLLSRAVQGFEKKDLGVADQVQKEWATRFGDLNRDLYLEGNPVPLKYAMAKMGLIESDEMRLPLTALDEKFRTTVDRALKAGGLL